MNKHLLRVLGAGKSLNTEAMEILGDLSGEV